MGGIVQSAMLVAFRIIVTASVKFYRWIGTFWTKTRMDWIWDLVIGLGLAKNIKTFISSLMLFYSNLLLWCNCINKS